MKSKSILFFLFFLFAFTGCKYEDGPGISFRTASNRVQGDWVIENLYVDGADSLEDFNSKNEYCIYYSFVDQKYSDYYIIGVWETSPAGPGYAGSWGLHDDDKYLWFYLGGFDYKPYGPVFQQGVNWKILRLANKEMWLETQYYNHKNYEIHFKAK